MTAAIAWARISSPVDDLLAETDGRHLLALHFASPSDDAPTPAGRCEPAHPLLAQLRDELAQYFAGQRRTFDVPLAPQGTPFQRSVWMALLAIPYGATESYGALAARIGKPAAVRAVGLANGRNPVPILIPCHRVIGADGTLTGYGGGLERKAALLALENACWRAPAQRSLAWS